MTTTDPARLAELLAVLDSLQSTLTNALTGSRPQARGVSDAAATQTALSPVAAMLLHVQTAILRNPAAAKGAVVALSQLGRSHAATPEGAELLDRIVASPQVAKLRTLWETVTLNVLDEIDEPSPVPAAWLDLVLDGLANDGLADAIAAIRPEGFA